MIRPRFTLARIALAGAGLMTAAGIGAAAIPPMLASAPAAATSASPAPATTPTPGPKGLNAKRQHSGLALRHVIVKEVARQAGLTVQQVRDQVRAGKTLDAIAGSTAQAVRDAALDTITKRLDAARAKGTITAAQEATRLARAKVRIARVMAATPHPKAAAAA
ncbi:MAG TPA: hypothetical protein VGL20_04125 [Candidatus Dormibacteraeota bacterium]|jgi:hypothetical protein